MTSGDDIDLASLADREGASGLLDAIEQGGKVGLAALAALPMATDAPVAFRRLAQLTLLTQGDARLHVMKTIQGIAQQPVRHGEPLDQGGLRECAQALIRIARDTSAPAQHRVLAIGTVRLRAFAAHVDVAQVPTDFDAPP